MSSQLSQGSSTQYFSANSNAQATSSAPLSRVASEGNGHSATSSHLVESNLAQSEGPAGHTSDGTLDSMAHSVTAEQRIRIDEWVAGQTVDAGQKLHLLAAAAAAPSDIPLDELSTSGPSRAATTPPQPYPISTSPLPSLPAINLGLNDRDHQVPQASSHNEGRGPSSRTNSGNGVLSSLSSGGYLASSEGVIQMSSDNARPSHLEHCSRHETSAAESSSGPAPNVALSTNENADAS